MIIDDELRRYDVPLLADPSVQATLRHAGYAVLPPVLGPDDLAALHAQAEELLALVGGSWGEQFFTVGRITDTAVRARAIAAAGDVVRPRLAPLYVPGTRIMASAFQVKPPSPSSALNPHQDSSLVDEARWPGVYGWVALGDTDEASGGLQVVPGSHRLVNPQRTLSVPWQLAGREDVLRPHLRSLAVPAGGVVLFDSALVHASPPNHGDRVRLAVNSFARPAGAPLLHVHQDDRTTPGTVELYEIEPSFLYGDDIMARPGPPHRFVGERRQHVIRATDEELDATLAALVAEAEGARQPVGGAA